MDDSASRFQTSFHVIYDEIMPAISHYHTHASLGNRFSPPPRPFRGHFPADITAELSALHLSLFLPHLLPFLWCGPMTSTTTSFLSSAAKLRGNSSKNALWLARFPPSLWRASATIASKRRKRMQDPIGPR